MQHEANVNDIVATACSSSLWLPLWGDKNVFVESAVSSPPNSFFSLIGYEPGLTPRGHLYLHYFLAILTPR